jgi:hypothetical protein
MDKMPFLIYVIHFQPMKTYRNRYFQIPALFLIMLGTLPGAFDFTAVGNNLVVTLNQDILGASTVTNLSFASIGFVLIDAYSSDPISSQTVPLSGDLTLTLPANPATTDTYGLWGVPSAGMGVVDSNDFYGILNFVAAGNQGIGFGQVIQLDAGTVTLDNFFLGGGMAPDNVIPGVTQIQFINSSGAAMSNPFTVPIPEAGSTGLAVGLVALFGMGFLGRARR